MFKDDNNNRSIYSENAFILKPVAYSKWVFIYNRGIFFHILAAITILGT